jgi:pyruvate dehydrogenase (quinone)
MGFPATGSTGFWVRYGVTRTGCASCRRGTRRWRRSWFDEYAELIGLRGVKVERSAQIADAWRQAFAADGPVVINALTDPEEPPIRPHVTVEQAKEMTMAFMKAPKDGFPGAVEAAKQFAKEFKPGR